MCFVNMIWFLIFLFFLIFCGNFFEGVWNSSLCIISILSSYRMLEHITLLKIDSTIDILEKIFHVLHIKRCFHEKLHYKYILISSFYIQRFFEKSMMYLYFSKNKNLSFLLLFITNLLLYYFICLASLFTNFYSDIMRNPLLVSNKS